MGGPHADLVVTLVPSTEVTLEGAPRAEIATGGSSGPLQRGDQVGRYVILDRVGAGGMGMVYAAYDPELDRKLALKLLRRVGDGRDAARRRRLSREAQAMARLSHRNVITVHDVGTYHHQVFVAMEFIAGKTLSQWLDAGPRPWREVRRVFVPAGRGLSAAHGAGLVHRDFKPDNVMVADDGRVVVMDFGLARAASSAATSADDSGFDLEPDTGPRPSLCLTVTAAGTIMGTPAYMSPEQHAGDDVDDRSDQFAFCVALYEGLFGQRPFAGKDVASLAYSVTEGRLRPPPPGVRVPGWLWRVVARGLSTDPARRFRSMGHLLDALARDRAPLRRAAWVGLGLLAAATAGWVAQGAADNQVATPCERGARRVDEVWNGSAKQDVSTALRGTGLPYAQAQWPIVASGLDAYAKSWRSSYRDACEAFHERHEQSAAMFDRRMECLSGRLDDFRAVVGMLQSADADVATVAAATVQTLPDTQGCADMPALMNRVEPPTDPAVRALVDTARRELGEVAALSAAGKDTLGLSRARELERSTSDLEHAPLRAEVLLRLGELEHRVGQTWRATSHFQEALATATRAHDDTLAAAAAVGLVTLAADGVDPEHGPQAEAWTELADALVDRAGGPAPLQVRLWAAQARMLRAQNRLADAAQMRQRVVDRLRQVHGDADPRLADAAVALAEVAEAMGDRPRAAAALHQALSIRTAALGTDHPDLAAVWVALGRLADQDRDPVVARGHYAHAVAVLEAAVGDRDPALIEPLRRLGANLVRVGQTDAGLRSLRRALTLAEQTTAAPEALAVCRFELARGLWSARAEAAGARALAEQALRSAPSDASALVMEIEVFIARIDAERP